MFKYFALIVCVCLFSCESDKDKPYNIIISGKITDQVTNQPVAGAKILCGVIPGLMPGGGLLGVIDSAISESNGMYSLSTQSQSSEDGASLTAKTKSIAVLVVKEGYALSNRKEIYYLDAHNTNMNFELFHYCQLNLHLINDTIINNTDAVDISVTRSISVGSLQEAYFTCNSRKLDSIFVIKKIPGNVIYNIQVLKPGGATFSPQVFYSITPKPDVINNFTISF
jgi:hypothetical protein